MSRFGNDILRGHRELSKRLGKPTFRWNGADYSCIANVAGSSSSLSVAGFAAEADLVLFVEAAILPDPGPALKQTVVYKAKTYRIDGLALMPGDAEIKFTCNDPTKGV